MKYLLIIGIAHLFFSEVKSERIVSDLFHLKTKGDTDSVLIHTFLLYRVKGDDLFEKANKDAIRYLERKIISKTDTIHDDSLVGPILYYTSVLLNDWKDRNRGKLYCNAAFRNLSLICMLSGDIFLLRRLFFSTDSGMIPVLQKESGRERKFRKNPSTLSYSIY